MNRMHPQDLRAELAMRFYELTITANPDDDRTRTTVVGWSVSAADNLLAELERTAKPASTRTCSEVDETVLVPTPSAGLTFPAPDINPHDPLRDRLVVMRVKDLCTRQEAALVASLKAEGAREERERIIAMVMRPGSICYTNEAGLRAALAPKDGDQLVKTHALDDAQGKPILRVYASDAKTAEEWMARIFRAKGPADA